MLWNLKVHNLVQSSPKFVKTMSQIIHSKPSYPTSLRQIVILSSHLCVYFPGGLPLSGFLLKYNTSSFSLSFRPHALPIISFLTCSTLKYFVWIYNRVSPWYAIVSDLLLLQSSSAHFFSYVTLLLNTLSICPLVL